MYKKKCMYAEKKGANKMNSRNLTLLTDLYELTMMQGYFERQENETVVFDVFSVRILVVLAILLQPVWNR